MYEESVKMLASRLKLRNTSILVTGATGLIGSCVIDVLAKANDEYGANIKIYALSRSKNKIEKILGQGFSRLFRTLLIRWMTPLSMIGLFMEQVMLIPKCMRCNQ